MLLKPFLLTLLDTGGIYREVVVGEHLCATFKWTFSLEWRLIDVFFEALFMDPVAAEGVLGQHAFGVLTRSQITHKRLRTDRAFGLRDKSDEIVGEVLHSVVDLRLRVDYNLLTRTV